MEGNENGNPLEALILYALEADRHVTLQRAMKGVACGILHPAERLDTLVSPAKLGAPRYSVCTYINTQKDVFCFLFRAAH